MSAEGGTKAVVAALVANSFIALCKFGGWALTGGAASSLLAEAIHSVADAGNQALLLVGGRRSQRAATPDHPFGYGRERYVFAFIVAIVLFSVGGLFALYEAYHKYHELQEGHANELLDSQWWWLPIAILVAAIVAESLSFRTAIRESSKTKGRQTWGRFIRSAKSPELPVILLEDLAALIGLIFALIGVGLTLITGNGYFDVAGTAMIGLLLVAVAVTLAIETKSLLVGESATPQSIKAIEARAGRDRGRGPDHPHEDPAPRPGGGAGRGQDRGHPDRFGQRGRGDDQPGRDRDPGRRPDGHGALPGAGHLPHRLRTAAAPRAPGRTLPLIEASVDDQDLDLERPEPRPAG